MKNKGVWIVGILIALIIIINLFIFLPEESNKTKVGVILPLTGFLANSGQDTQKAIELAFDDLNAKKDIKLIYEDGKCDATEALTTYRKLVDIDNVNFIIGPFCGQSSIVILDALNKDKVITISPGAPDNELSIENDYFFRTRVPNKAETKKIVDFLLEKNIKKVAVYTAKNTFGQSYRDSFIKQFVENGGEIVFDDGSTDYQSDFKTDVVKIKEINPEALFLVPASRQQMGLFVKQLKELNFNAYIIGASVTEQQDLLDAAGTAAEGIIYPYVLPKKLNIVDNFKQKYNGNSPSMEVLNGYDSFNILYDKIKECDSNKECVKDRLNNLKDFNGAMGLINFDEFGDSQVELILKTIKNGEFIEYEK